MDIQQSVTSTIKSYASKEPMDNKCKFRAPISVHNDGERIESFMIVEVGTVSLLRKKTAVALGVLKLGLTEKINQINKTAPFPKIKGITVKLSINPAVKPVQQPVRRVPVAVEAKVKEKLNEALEKDIIEIVKGPSP